MSEYFIIANAPSVNLSHAELSEMQKAGKVKVYGPYSAEAMLKYFSEGKLKGNTVVYEKSAPFTQTFSDVYPSLKSGGVDLGTPPVIAPPPQPGSSQLKSEQKADPPLSGAGHAHQQIESDNYIIDSNQNTLPVTFVRSR